MAHSPNDDRRRPATIESLERLRLRLYAIVFPIGLLTIMVIWVTGLAGGSSTAYNRLIQPLIALVFTIFALLLAWRPSLLRVLEPLGLAIVCVYFVAELYLSIYQGRLRAGSQNFVTFLQWLPIVYFLAFLIFSTGRALAVSSVFYSFLLLPGLFYLATYGVRGLLMPELTALAQIYLSNAVYIPLISGIALLKERYLIAAAQAEAMARAAERDYLTGIYNRRHLAGELDREIGRAIRSEQPLAVIIGDIDRFKQLNDTLGHAVGDRVLVGFADLIQQNLRVSDVLGRWGGEEFLILAPATDFAEAHGLAERLRALVEQRIFELGAGVTSSFGVTVYTPGDTPESLVARADAALYRAKQLGRNRVESIDPA